MGLPIYALTKEEISKWSTFPHPGHGMRKHRDWGRWAHHFSSALCQEWGEVLAYFGNTVGSEAKKPGCSTAICFTSFLTSPNLCWVGGKAAAWPQLIHNKLLEQTSWQPAAPHMQKPFWMLWRRRTPVITFITHSFRIGICFLVHHYLWLFRTGFSWDKSCFPSFL